MKRNVLFKGAAVALSLSLVGAPASAAVTKKDKKRARLAARYLVSKQNPDGTFGELGGIGPTADAVMAFAAVRRGPKAMKRSLSYLRSTVAEADTTGEIAKIVLALVATDRDPRRFAGRNLVKELRTSMQPDGRLGPEAAVIDHALGMLALSGAGKVPAAASATWLAEAQCPDGGWQYDLPWSESEDDHCSGGEGDWFRSETDATSYAIQALQAHPGFDSFKRNPFAFLRSTRDPIKKGWGYSSDFSLSSANSTSLALQAYKATGRRLPRGAKGALRALQYPSCSKHRAAFAFTWTPTGNGGYRRSGPDVFATPEGIRGLMEAPLPLMGRKATKAAPGFRCG